MPIGETLARAGEDVFSKAYDYIGSKGGIGKFAIDSLWSMNREFKGTPTGEAIYGMAEKGIKARNDISDQLKAPLNKFKVETKKDSGLAMHMTQHRNSDLQTIHNSLPQNSPGRTALAPLMADPDNHGMTLKALESKFHSEANMHGMNAAFGPDSINLAATVFPEIRAGGTRQTKAEAQLAILSQIFKDEEGAKKGALGVMQSKLKSDVQDYMTETYKRYYLSKAQGKGFVFPMNVAPEYIKGGTAEQLSHKYSMNFLAPLIAMSHMADFYKLATAPAQVLMKTLTSFSDPHMEQMKLASGIFFHTQHSIYDHDFNYRTGRLAELTKQPNAAALIHKIYHQPLFNNVRMAQLSTFGSAAYHSAQMWGKQAVRGDLRAIAELHEMHLDPQAIIARNGDLTDDELSQAIWHYTNNRLFIDRPMDRSRFAQKSPFMRVASMFHGYVTKEGHFITRELHKMAAANDYVGIAHFAGVVGILFPATAPLLYSLQTLVRTASPTKAKQQLDSYYQPLIHPTGIGNFTLAYLDLLGHFGAAGAFMQYIHAAANHRLAGNILGPVPGVGTGIVEDVVGGFKGEAEEKTTRRRKGEERRPWRPLERDFLRYMTIPIFGAWASEHLVPKNEPRRRRR